MNKIYTSGLAMMLAIVGQPLPGAAAAKSPKVDIAIACADTIEARSKGVKERRTDPELVHMFYYVEATSRLADQSSQLTGGSCVVEGETADLVTSQYDADANGWRCRAKVSSKDWKGEIIALGRACKVVAR